MKPRKFYKTLSLQETQKLGEELGRSIATAATINSSSAKIFALVGNLGAGKTTFVQGFFKGVGLQKRAQSPTFILMRRHALKGKNLGRHLYHADVYRLKGPEQLEPLKFKEIIKNPKSVILVEWADRIRKALPKHTTWIKFEHGKKENERRIIIGGAYH